MTLEKPLLMYGCEIWKMNKSDEKKIDVFSKQVSQTYPQDNVAGQD